MSQTLFVYLERTLNDQYYFAFLSINVIYKNIIAIVIRKIALVIIAIIFYYQ